MKLSEIKKYLSTAESVNFKLPSGIKVPGHFHVTEIGLVTKHFIDCGGTERIEKVVNFQLWDANDFEHRLQPKKLLSIISLSEEKLGIGDLETEVEYQSDTIGKYGLDYDGSTFQLVSKRTDCLAKDNCGIPLLELANKEAKSCTPISGCC